MAFRHLPWLVAAATLLTACGNHGDDMQVFGGDTDIVSHRVTLHDGRVTIKSPGVPDAVVDADGQLSIDGHDVAVNDAQRALLKSYNAAAQTMRADALATGKAGVATATQAMSAAAGKITGADNAEATKAKVEAAAQGVKQAAAKICDDLAAMKATQDQLATQLDAFKPYADALANSNVERCREHTAH
ncbi:DUF2884 family protein [Dyella sp. 20L07]|uniref:DUF2884 family protein n=1 Tax=Dyella sp. 20L07 TaxID=3384240 RepID=UPI003D288DD8